MKNKLSYIVMSLLFFNLLFIFFYYFKIVNFLYIDFVNINKLVNVLLTNVFVIAFDVFYMILYRVIKLERLSYLFTTLLGVIIGGLVSVLILGINNHEVIDYLGIISFFTIDTLFFSYSLYFEKDKEFVFK